MTKLALSALVTVVAMTSASFAQTPNAPTPPAPVAKPVQQITCDLVSAMPMDQDFIRIGIRRPTAGDTKKPTDIYMSVQVDEAISNARTDTGADDPKVDKVYRCPGTQVGFRMLAHREGGWDVTEIPVPKTAKDLKIKSCNNLTKTCAYGLYDGDPNKWVTLGPDAPKPDAAPFKLSRQYKD